MKTKAIMIVLVRPTGHLIRSYSARERKLSLTPLLYSMKNCQKNVIKLISEDCRLAQSTGGFRLTDRSTLLLINHILLIHDLSH